MARVTNSGGDDSTWDPAWDDHTDDDAPHVDDDDADPWELRAGW